MRFLIESHYAERRQDLDLWGEPIRDALRRYGWKEPQLAPTASNGGTNVVFRLGNAHFVKVYTPFFGGREARGIELRALRRVANVQGVPVARVVLSGELEPEAHEWPWPFIVTTALPGMPADEQWSQLDRPSQLSVAKELGRALSSLHASGLTHEIAMHSHRIWPGGFAQMLQVQLDKVRSHPDLAPVRLVQCIEAKTLARLGRRWQSLLHGDLTAEHLWIEGNRLSGLLDFGDALVGDPAYEWVPLVSELFERDAEAFWVAVESHSPGQRLFPDLAERIGLYAVLHRWTSAERIIRWVAKTGAQTPTELGAYLLGAP